MVLGSSAVIDPEAGSGGRLPGRGRLGVAVRLAGLGAVVFLVATTSPGPGLGGRGLWILVLLVLAGVAWLGWTAGALRPVGPARVGSPVSRPATSHQPTPPLATWGWGASRPTSTLVTAVLGVAGGVLVGLSPSGYVMTFPCVAVFFAAVALPVRRSVPLLAAVVASISVGSLFGQAPNGGWAYATLLPVGVFLGGLNRRQRLLGAEEQARGAALAERARIARELHDVLAHSLAGLTIQLEAARAVLAAGADPARALRHVEHAHHLSVDGLVEARRAVAALREDAPPLVDQLRSLVEVHGQAAILEVCGPPRPLPAEVSLALFRAAQEALTNASRHAPGAPVQVRLGYRAGETVLEVTDRHPNGPVGPAARAEAGSGYGLVGMRERVKLAGGSVSAGPWENGWRVEVRVPS